MEKLTKYNQITFSIISTALIIGFIAFVIFLISEYVSSRNRYSDNRMISNIEAKKLAEENKRKFVVTYQNLTLIDSLRQLYLIPISQKELEDAEEIIPAPPATQAMYIEAPRTSEYSYYYGYKSLNNLLIYNLKNNISYPIFNHRISIVDYIKYSINKNPYIIIIGCDSDTNKDEILNQEDLLHIYHYDCISKNLTKITKEPLLILHSRRLSNSDFILFKVAIDKDEDKQYSREQEASIYKKLDLNSLKFEKLISDEVNDQLQKLLDG